MYDMNRRLEKVEQKLSLNEKPAEVTIVFFGAELPPDRREGNTTIHCVRYDDVCQKKERQ